MKKILHISKYYYPFHGGIEQTARDCVTSLLGRFEQKVICFNHEKGDCNDIIDGIDIHRCGCQRKVFSQSISLNIIKTLKQMLESYNPDYIVLHYPNPYVSLFLLRYIKANNHLVLYWHSDIMRQKVLRVLFKHQSLRLVNTAFQIIATSPNYIDGSPYLQRVKEKCIVIPSCINTERLKINSKSDDLAKQIRDTNVNKIICVSVGRHVPYKGFEYLIKANDYLDDQFEFYIAGEGELTNKLKKMATSKNNIHFLGSVDDDTLKAYLLACDIFCFPSITKNEAFGLALAEGMYFGKPAVTFTISGSGVNYVSLDGVTGIECPNKDSKAFAKALNTLRDDIILRNKLGQNANKRVIEKFTIESYKKNINMLFDRMANI